MSIKAPFISILLCLVLALCPFPIEAAAAAENTARVSVGNNYCLAILDDNTLWGIGQFTHEGRLDSGNREYALKTLDDFLAYSDAMKRYKTIVLTDNVSEIGAYYNQMLIRKNDGSIWTWGFNEHGGIGDGQEKSNTIRSSKVLRLEFDTAAEQLFISDNQKSRLLSDWTAEAVASGEIPACKTGFRADWNGYWDSNVAGIFEAVQAGNEVSGYSEPNHFFFIRGSINGNKLKGLYRGGVFELTMMPDGKSFTGYVFLHGSAEPAKWTGKKR